MKNRNTDVRRTMTDGSLTVEASFVVPVAFFAVYLFLQLFIFQRIQSDMQAAMNNVVRELAEYGTPCSQLSSLTDTQAEDLFAKMGIDTAVGRVAGESYMGYLLRREIEDEEWIGWIQNGTSGIDVSGSSMYDRDGKVVMAVEYRFAPQNSLFGALALSVEQRTEAQSFYGRERKVKEKPDDDEDDAEDEYVYVAANGGVYHLSSTCTYLKIVIREIAPSEISTARNKNGEKYRPCTYCDHTPVGKTVFITDYGNRYHTTISCGELKRTYEKITKEDAEEKGLRACRKCGAESES